MAVSTANEKLAVMELGQVFTAGIPLSPGSFGQDDKQQLIWGYPGVLWGEIDDSPAQYQGAWVSIRLGL